MRDLEFLVFYTEGVDLFFKIFQSYQKATQHLRDCGAQGYIVQTDSGFNLEAFNGRVVKPKLELVREPTGSSGNA